MADELVPVVKPNRISALQPGHPSHQVGIGCFDHQMVVVAHEAIRVDLPISFLPRLGESFDKIEPIHVVKKNVLPTVSTAHDMVHPRGIGPTIVVLALGCGPQCEFAQFAVPVSCHAF